MRSAPMAAGMALPPFCRKKEAIPVHRLDNAIDYALDEKKSSRAENRESLEGEIDKALNKDQSEQDLFQSAIGCTIDSAFEDMCQIKKIWHKEKGVQGFHLVQSFAPGEISPELAHQIGMEFADRLLGGKFQAVVSTHLNTKCIHNHIVCAPIGQEVKQGEVIGYVGTTGNSTGNHLHFEVWQNGERTDALGYFKAKE